MYTVEWITTRPSRDVPWFSHPKLLELNEARNDSVGFLGKSVMLSEDKLTRTVITQWENQECSEKFFVAQENLIAECNTLTLIYNQENGITLERSVKE